MARLDYLTTCANTRNYTGHYSPSFIFDPKREQPSMSAYLVVIIQRWVLTHGHFEYSISHVQGEETFSPELEIRWRTGSLVRRLMTVHRRMKVPGVEPAGKHVRWEGTKVPLLRRVGRYLALPTEPWAAVDQNDLSSFLWVSASRTVLKMVRKRRSINPLCRGVFGAVVLLHAPCNLSIPRGACAVIHGHCRNDTA